MSGETLAVTYSCVALLRSAGRARGEEVVELCVRVFRTQTGINRFEVQVANADAEGHDQVLGLFALPATVSDGGRSPPGAAHAYAWEVHASDLRLELYVRVDGREEMSVEFLGIGWTQEEDMGEFVTKGLWLFRCCPAR